jgi:hypothetical protein
MAAEPEPAATEPEPSVPEPEPVAAEPEPSEPAPVGHEPVEAEPHDADAEPESDGSPVLDPERRGALDPEHARVILDEALDTLGAAHHRPFSRG